MSEEKKKKRRVTILAVKNNYRTGIPYYMVPLWRDSDRTLLTGLENEFDNTMTEQKRNAILIKMGYNRNNIHEIVIPIRHGQILRPDDEKEDYGILQLCKICPDIALSNREIDGDKHLFFISDPESESVVNLTKERLMVEAKSKILNEGGDFAKLRSLSLYLGGINMSGLSLNVVLDRLLREASIRPEKIIEFYGGDHSHHVMIKELEFFNVIHMKEGKFYDGEKFLGTLPEAIALVSDPENSELTNSLGTRLIEAKKEA